MDSHTSLKGHSGAQLTIEQRGNQAVVRKRAAGCALNERLRAQMLKQQIAQGHGVPCPVVFDSGDSDGCFYFEMEYLPSISVAQIQIDSLLFDRTTFVDFLESYLLGLAATKDGCLDPERFRDKIEQLQLRCESAIVLTDLLPAIGRISGFLRSADWNGIPKSKSHGDLTLENILFNRERGLFLIDFDHVDLDSYYLDIGKLFQDFWGQWCLRELALGGAGQIGLLSAMLNLDALGAATLKRFEARWPGLREKLLQMVLLHLLRVLPYCARRELAVFAVIRANQLLAEAELHGQRS